MRMLAQQYFHDLFQRHDSVVTPVIGVVCHSVSTEDNNALTTPFTKDEFHVAMFSMHPDKCPGPDGFCPGFYQHFWSLCSDKIFKECHGLTHDNSLLI